MFLNWKNQCHQNDCPTQSSLQIQWNPYQMNNNIFLKTRTKLFTICIETQKTPNNQINLDRKKKELKESCFLTWNYATKLESWKLYDNGKKSQTYSSVTQGRNPGIYPYTYGQLIYDKEVKNIQWRKNISSICGAGKTGQLYVKE